MITNTNYAFSYRGELDPISVKRLMGERINEDIYEVKIHGNLKVVRGTNLTNFLNSVAVIPTSDQGPCRWVVGLVSGPIKEKVFLVNDIEDKNNAGEEKNVSELIDGNYNLKIEYNDGCLSAHRNLNVYEIAEKILEADERDLKCYVASCNLEGGNK